MKEKVIHWALMSCEEATLHLEKQQAGEISWLQNLRLRSHLKICKWCRSYNQKRIAIDHALKKIMERTSTHALRESDIHDFKEKTKAKLKK